MTVQKTIDHTGLILHHDGLVVREQESAQRFFEGLDYVGTTAFDPELDADFTIYKHDSRIWTEIMCPKSEDSPLTRVVARDAESVVRYNCYVSDDVGYSVLALKAARLQPVRVTPLKPTVLFGKAKACFYSVEGMGLIRIFENVLPP